ncbi:DUF438 domain-containing protein [Hugonella massiliensis]|uniref:DUF438 domain-containing protein n=1 Tax=Hugonella massiliensis TaxID=1720315 RepID=UPI00073EB991|nr:DUF438 domain-containing protein [Hugonella massiliensis]
MEISPQTKLADLVAAYPFMRAGMADIDKKFAMLQTPIGKVMMRKVTLADVSALSGRSVDDLLAAIAEKTGATVAGPEASAEEPAEGEPKGDAQQQPADSKGTQMGKLIDFNKTVFDNVSAHPEVVDVMVSLGFDEITKPGRLESVGSVVTLNMGSQMKHVPLEEMVAAFEAAGFEVTGAGEEAAAEESAPTASEKPAPAAQAATEPADARDRQALIEQFVRRLSNGEDLESVRADFVRDFASVSAHEIAQAEQNLISSGMPVSEVQQLCDVHSALFHGRTDDECAAVVQVDGLPAGHPSSVLKRENDALIVKLDEVDAARSNGASAEKLKELLAGLKPLRNHYAKKEQLFMPFLYGHGVTGPMDVMWGVDDEIVQELSAIVRELPAAFDAALASRIEAVTTRMREMVYKEEQIFLPLCRDHFTDEEWFAVYRDLDEYKPAFVETKRGWLDADVWVREKEREAKAALSTGEIRLSTGTLSVAQLDAILKLLPLDLTFIDATETTRFFTREGKIFARPIACLGREVWQCHPPAIIPMVKDMIADFKSGARENMEVWNPMPGNPVRVLYVPVWGEDRTYLGTLEIVQQFGEMLPKLKELIG